MNEPSVADGAGMRRHAVRLLARRDHARAELRTKMLRKFGAAVEPAELEPELEAVLDWCEQHGFLDDQRFAGVFVRSRIERRQGPLRIRADLRQRGVAADLIDAALRDAQCDWFDLAAEALQHRFREPPLAARDKAKRLRFLQSRGFDAEQSYQALSQAESGPDEDGMKKT